VDWKQQTRQVYISYGETLIVLDIDDPNVQVNNDTLLSIIPPKIINSKTMIPVRFVSENLGFDVLWDGADYSISIYTPAQNTPNIYIPIVHNPQPPQSSDLPNPDTPFNVINGTYALTEEEHPITWVNDFSFPSEGSQIYTIHAASAISKVGTYIVEGNRIVVDIYNSVFDLPFGEQYITTTPSVYRVRAAQNAITPEYITRFVFDLYDSVEYNVTINHARTEVYVNFGLLDEPKHEPNTTPTTEVSNILYNIFTSSDEVSDTILLVCQENMDMNVFTLISPDRLVIDVNATELDIHDDLEKFSGTLFHTVRAVQNGNSTRIVLDLTSPVSYEIMEFGNYAVITIRRISYGNVVYDINANAFKLDRATGLTLNLNIITEQDRYYEGLYVFDLGADYSDFLGRGNVMIGDSYLSHVVIANGANGNTQLIFHQKQILAYIITETADHYVFQPVHPKKKYDRIVILDPGHGGSQPGAVHNGLFEKEINLGVTKKVKELLEANGRVKVYTTRYTDITLSLEERVLFANNYGDLFLSIHANSNPNVNTHGIMTFWNQHNHTGNLVLGDINRVFANTIQSNLLRATNAHDLLVREYDYYVIRHTRIPSALAEVGMMTNVHEANLMKTDDYRNKIAFGLFMGILEMFEFYIPIR
jgi:N-acetylmuramoyl-L-alanine amidase